MKMDINRQLLLASFFILAALPSLLTLEAWRKEFKSKSVTFIEDFQSLEPEAFLLFHLKSVSDKGRAWNLTEEDVEAWIQPSCTCEPLGNWTKEQCYCSGWGCPLPRNSFTGKLGGPDTDWSQLPCWKNAAAEAEERTPLVWLCHEGLLNYEGMIPRWMSFLCVHYVNMGRAKVRYNFSPGRVDPNSWEGGADAQYKWDLNSNDLDDETETFSGDFLHTESSVGTNRAGSPLVPEKVYFLEKTNFSVHFLQDFAEIRVSGPEEEFVIQGTKKCLERQDEFSMEECLFLISGKPMLDANCSLLRETVVTATKVLSFSLTNVTNLTLSHNPDEKVGPCFESIPNRIAITKLRHRDILIGVFADSIHEPMGEYEPGIGFPLRLSLHSVQLREQEFMNLPKFWRNFWYAKCPDQYCWRDLGKVGNPEVWRTLSPDEDVWMNFLYFCIPAVPVLAYFLSYMIV